MWVFKSTRIMAVVMLDSEGCLVFWSDDVTFKTGVLRKGKMIWEWQ